MKVDRVTSPPPPPPPPPSKTGRRGAAQLLLFSVAGTAAAAGLTVGRWIVAETGEVLLLMMADDDVGDDDGGVGGFDADDDFAPPPPPSYVYSDHHHSSGNDERRRGAAAALTKGAGKVLVGIASSPHARAAPLILLFLSSTALVVGVLLTWRDLRQCFSPRVRACRRYAEEYSERIMAAMGASDIDDLVSKMNEKHVEWKNFLGNRVGKTMECLDGMVLDDILGKLVKSGVEFYMGVVGGVVLYSIPEEIFANTPNGAKNARRRLIRAADPSLERMMFRPGGAWDALPPYLRESLAKCAAPGKGIMSSEEVAKLENSTSRVGTEISLLGSMDRPTTDDDDMEENDDDSSDTPLASPVQSVDVETTFPSPTYPLVRHAQVVPAAGGERVPIQNSNEEGPKETVADAVSATVGDLVVSKILGARKPPVEHVVKSSGNGGNNHEQEVRKVQGEYRLAKPPPPLNVEKPLCRLTMAASFLFLCHLRFSPSTRRAWGSAAKVLTSLGLASAAVGAGLASVVLGSNEGTSGALQAASNPLVGALCSKIFDEMGLSRVAGLSADIGNRFQWTLDRLREEIRGNKRLKATLAFMVLYAMRISWSTGGRHPGSTVNSKKILVVKGNR